LAEQIAGLSFSLTRPVCSLAPHHWKWAAFRTSRTPNHPPQVVHAADEHSRRGRASAGPARLRFTCSPRRARTPTVSSTVPDRRVTVWHKWTQHRPSSWPPSSCPWPSIRSQRRGLLLSKPPNAAACSAYPSSSSLTPATTVAVRCITATTGTTGSSPRKLAWSCPFARRSVVAWSRLLVAVAGHRLS